MCESTGLVVNVLTDIFGLDEFTISGATHLPQTGKLSGSALGHPDTAKLQKGRLGLGSASFQRGTSLLEAYCNAVHVREEPHLIQFSLV